MSWDYGNFPRHPVGAEKFKMIGRSTILSLNHYRVDPELGQVICEIFRVP